MDNFDYKKYLAEGKLLKESVNENVPDDGDVYGWYWPIADKAMERLKKDSKYSEASLGAVGSGDGSTYISITVDFPSGSEEHFDVFFDGEEGNEQVTNIESTFVSEGSKPDFIDIDGDGDKKESMKKAAKDKEATVDEDINYDVFDEKPIDFKSLLELGIKSSLLMGEDELMEISDAFEERGDEQSDRIASHLNSAIELMQNGYSKAAAPNLRRFQAACREALNELKKSVDEDINHDIDDSESYFSSQIDQIAQAEFGMDYHQLGRGEKEWVRDEIDNMNMQENEEGAKILTSRNKLEQTLNDISDELTDDQLDTISSMIVDLSSKIKKTLKK